MDQKSIIRALQEIRPGSIWTLNGDSYEFLIWLDVSQKPTEEELIDAIDQLPVETPIVVPTPGPPEIISDRQFFQQLAILGTITTDEALAAVKTGSIPATLQTFIDTLSTEQKFAAEMLVSGATQFERHHPMTIALAQGMGWSEVQLDALWTAANQL